MWRARRLQTDFELSTENRPWVAWICKAVQGLPLGLELAAAWIRCLSVREIALEIERDVRFLAATTRSVPKRHRSLQAVFDRDAAQAIAGTGLRLLSALIAKSLLRRAALIRHIEQTLVDRGCAILISDVWQDALGFYLALGWSAPPAVLLRHGLLD